MHTYGTRAEEVIDDATSLDDLGRDFGAGLSEAEVRYLAEKEWAKSADDVLWRRSKLGLRLPAEAEQAIGVALAEAAMVVPYRNLCSFPFMNAGLLQGARGQN